MMINNIVIVVKNVMMTHNINAEVIWNKNNPWFN